MHECCGHEHDPAHSHAHGCCGHSHGNDAWTRGFFACLQGFVLVMIGAVMCYFVASGRIDGRNPQTPYVTGWFKGLALCGGLGLIVMGVFNLITRRREVDCGHDHGHDHAQEGEGEEPLFHSHEGSVAGRALTLLVLSGSVAAAAMFTPDQLSSRYIQYKASAYGADRNSAARLKQVNPELAKASAGGLTLEKVKEYLKPDNAGNFPISVVNLHYMGGDPEYAAVMENQPVVTTGQVVKDELNPGPGNLRVFTMQVTCCAADARPYSIPVVFDGPAPDYVEMGWYNVTGTIGFTQERGIKVARVIAKKDGLQATIRPAPQGPSF
jgi:uncharacterized membrane protein YcgQ (UPF0703/DUF1980 family)